jgi:hypothetical protein
MNHNNSLSVTLEDSRNENEKEFSYGVLPAKLMLEKKLIEPIKYLENNSKLELESRGVLFLDSPKNKINVKINRLIMKTHRVSAYSPFVTFTLLSADVVTPSGNRRIGAYIRRGKVPVWSFSEIVEPTLNQPLSLLVKEFSAKISAMLFDYKISDEKVLSLNS